MFVPKVQKPQAKDQRRPRNEPRVGGMLPRSISDTYWRPLSPERSLWPSGNAIRDQIDEMLAKKTASNMAANFCLVPVSPLERNGLVPPFRAPAPRLPIQGKLKIGAVNDALEQEADRVAERVMRVSAPEPALRSAPQEVSRKCGPCEEEEKLQRKQAGTAEAASGEAPASVYEALRSPGQPLDAPTRAYFEPRFGQDFSGVRVHTGAAAAQSAREVNAYAYTVGHNMVFGPSQFAPGTQQGRRLLAHELTHVVQQGRSSVLVQMPRTDQRTSNGLTLEREANAAAERIEIGPILRPIGTYSFAAGTIFRARNPDASAGGLSTWYVSIGGKDKVFAVQIGQQPDVSKDRVSIRFASLRANIKNPAVSDRSMVLTISPAKLAPKIVDESETALPDGFSFQKVISIKLNDADENSPVVHILMSYFSGPVDAPFVPKEAGGGAYTKPVNVEQGWLAASDAYREMSVNFKSVYPKESLWAEDAYPMVHPRLGYGYVHPDRGFVPYPQPPLVSAAEKQRFAEEFIRTGVHLIPVAGSLIMIGEALAGKSIFGRRLSTTERIILGAGALLAEVGALIRAGKTAIAATRLSTVAGVSQVEALRLVMASRVLTGTEAATLERLSADIKAGRALSQADQVLAN